MTGLDLAGQGKGSTPHTGFKACVGTNYGAMSRDAARRNATSQGKYPWQGVKALPGAKGSGYDQS